tara:strand:- start:246 stop:488 length:243 start_codon:yes stop_codon:yes gene_type:complete
MTNEYGWDDSNWREEEKSFTTDKRYLELLENGPKSLSQSWILQALHQKWMRRNGYKYPDTENKGQLQSSFKEWNDGTTKV